MNKRSVGTAYEEQAASFLQKEGYEILERNFRNRQGEIDLIAREGDYLCFVEVKYRTRQDQGLAVEAVDIHKQRQISSVANYYLMKKGLSEYTACRFDVVAIDGENICLYRNAFDYQERP